MLEFNHLPPLGKGTKDHEIPCRVFDIDAAEQSELSLIENIIRLDMTPTDEIRAYKHFINEGSDLDAIAKRFGRTRRFIEGRLRLADLADPIFAALEEGKITEDQVETTRPDYQSSGDDNIIIQGVAGSPTSFGWVGLAFAEEAADQVREIPIAAEVGGECVEPNAETVADGSYPLSRPLFIYVSKSAADDNKAVVDYVDFYLTDEGLVTAVEEVGYVALPEDQRAATRKVWEDRTTGTQEAA